MFFDVVSICLLFFRVLHFFFFVSIFSFSISSLFYDTFEITNIYSFFLFKLLFFFFLFKKVQISSLNDLLFFFFLVFFLFVVFTIFIFLIFCILVFVFPFRKSLTGSSFFGSFIRSASATVAVVCLFIACVTSAH